MLRDNINLAIKNINERKFRAFLTLLGISIGIMAIVSLMGIGEGMQQSITGELSSLSDTIFVSTGKISATPMGGGFSKGGEEHLTDRDISDIQHIQNVRDVSPILFSNAIVSYNGESASVSLLGIDAESMENIFGMDVLGLEAGEFPEDGEQNKCVIGYNIAHNYFDSDIKIGSKIKIDGKSFVVSGIYKEQGAGFSTQTDDNIHITTRDFKKLTGEENISAAIVRVYDVKEAESTADEIEEYIDENHGEDNFINAITMSSIIDSIQQVLLTIQIVLLSIASISLIVASIGIMNTMLTSVMERTREIGIMKAIGATNKDVLLIFITEGIIISIIGGAIGILLGIIGSKGMSAALTHAMGGDLTPVITITSVALGLGVAIFVGMISSLYPARKASKMSPIEAVRYE